MINSMAYSAVVFKLNLLMRHLHILAVLLGVRDTALGGDGLLLAGAVVAVIHMVEAGVGKELGQGLGTDHQQ